MDYRADGVHAVVVPTPAPLALLPAVAGMALLRRRRR
ncbi:MAG: PEP-CTERM sorting domain-containing protein [Phycisphaerales bacterium]|nr:PEP-CTERM sorting domain-containing protein [Phycisphaerales bacterium]